jgi:trehalose synthase-fused probable maltokinase
MSASYLQGLADAFARQAQEVLDLLACRVPLPGPGVTEKADAVLSRALTLIERFQAVASIPCGTACIRCHGDLHLGQVLVVNEDFLFIDFEGEPLRSLAERRQKVSPLRDVAGMLRSFHYAARSVLYETAGPETVTPAAGADRRAEAWRAWVGSAYLGAYLETAAGAPFLPAAERDLQTLLDGFVLDKAFYELRYELNNRPEWVAIPLDGILSIAGGRPDTTD